MRREALRAHFRRRAVERIAELEPLARRLAASDADQGAAEAVRGVGHQLAGTAAGFGFPALGDLARRAELAEPEDLRGALGDLLAALAEIAESESADPSRGPVESSVGE